MKRNLMVILVLAAALTLFAGCGDDDSPTNPAGDNNTPDTGTITATVDGNALDFSTDSVGMNQEDGWYVFVGADQAGAQNIVVTLLATVGTFPVGGQDEPAITMVYNSGAWFASMGTLTVTAVSDDNIAGTFSGTFDDILGNSIEVTNGAFDVPVTQIP